nr:MAK10-like protein [Tanacetum cinerariifolium]
MGEPTMEEYMTRTREGYSSGIVRPKIEDKDHDEVFLIWKAFGRITRDLGSFGEETDKTTDLHQHFSRLCSQQLETASQFLHDAVLENQLLSVLLLICLGEHDCVERIPSGDYSKPSHEGYRNNIELPVGNNVVPLRSDTIRLVQNGCSFHELQSECEIDRTDGGKLCNKNTDESWEIIENLALYNHKGWDETKEFVKPVKIIATPQGVSKTPDRRLLELEDKINFLLKESQPTPTSSSAHTPQALVREIKMNYQN